MSAISAKHLLCLRKLLIMLRCVQDFKDVRAWQEEVLDEHQAGTEDKYMRLAHFNVLCSRIRWDKSQIQKSRECSREVIGGQSSRWPHALKLKRSNAQIPMKPPSWNKEAGKKHRAGSYANVIRQHWSNG